MIHDEQYPVEDWKYEVREANTQLGYLQWRRHLIEEDLDEDHEMNELVLILLQKNMHLGLLTEELDRTAFLWTPIYSITYKHCELTVEPSMDDKPVSFQVAGSTGRIYIPTPILENRRGLAADYSQFLVMHKDVPMVEDFSIYNKIKLT